MSLEQMSDFFTARVDGYDRHMLEEVEGCQEGYLKIAEYFPKNAKLLLDLGCGTGLELDALFKQIPDLSVTGIDLTAAMLDKLKSKFPGKSVTLIQADYLTYDFGTEQYDAALSFQTLHHFTLDVKQRLYRKLCASLKPGGCYLECDYMAADQKEEDFYFAENIRLRTEQGISEGEFYHYDTPCTVFNQQRLLKTAGFCSVQEVWKQDNTHLLIAAK